MARTLAQPHAPITFRLTPSLDAAMRRVAERAGVTRAEVLRNALWHWSRGQLQRTRRVGVPKLPAWLVCPESTWFGFSPSLYGWPYPAGRRQLPRERKSVTVCVWAPQAVARWFEGVAKAYGDVPISLLYFAAVACYAADLGVLIDPANQPPLEKPKVLVKKPELRQPPPPSSADFEVED